MIPKDPVENLKWRIRCRERALVDRKFRDALYQAAMDDVLFFCAAFLWVYEPRSKVKQKPMVPWCIAGGTLVVTNRGLVPIEKVDSTFLVWDGTMWVAQEGCIYKGERETISAYGIELTPDHRVFTKQGWQHASEGFEREEIQLPDCYQAGGICCSGQRKKRQCVMAMPLRVRKHNNSRQFKDSVGSEKKLRLHEGLAQNHAWNVSNRHVPNMGEYDSEMHESECNQVSSAWRKRHCGLPTLAGVFCELFGGHGGKARRQNIGSNQQRRKLRTIKLQMGNKGRAGKQHSCKPIFRDVSGSIHNGADRKDSRGNSTIDRRESESRNSRRRSIKTTSSGTQTVYDLVNCGPRHAFTVIGKDGQPLLVHNCHQEPVILAIDETISEAMDTEHPVSLTLKKSRAQGGTYCYLAVTMHRAMRESGFTIGLVTRNEALVDSKVDDSAVMFKVAWMLDRLPAWMLPDGYSRSMTDHVIRLPNESGWSGYAATGDVARGGRTSVFCFDEPGSEEFVAGNKDYKILSSVSHVSNCILLISTFGVDSGVFYEAATDKDNPRVYSLSWKDNPDHSKNIYTVKKGVAVALRPEEQEAVTEYVATHQREIKAIERRGHKIEDHIQSPWYNAHRLLPGATPRFIARELDEDCRGAVGKVFSTDLLDRVKREHCKRPVWVGNPVFDSETLKLTGLIPREDGALKLWFKPGIDNSPPMGPFTAGCDIASGGVSQWATNSVLTALDNRTGEQVVEYAIKGLEPRPFARRCVGLCMWLWNALLGWEDSGASGGFAKEIMEVIYYGSVFYRNVTQLGSQKKSRKPGWPCQDADKADMFEQFALAMEDGKCVPRSEEMIVECGEYEWDGGKIVHVPTKNKGATEKNHADRAISAAGCWLVFNTDIASDKIDTSEETGQTPEYGSFLWREQQEQRGKKPGSVGYGIRDILKRI